MVFVTRKLNDSSPLLRWGEATGVEVRGESFLRFEAVDFVPPTDSDWWFFYSSRAVSFAGEIPVDVRTAAIGTGTAKSLLQRCGKVDFCGSGSPERVAEDFLAVAEGQRVFFPRARQSRLSVQTALAERITALDAICYDNLAVSPEREIITDTFIFTSPLNVAAYLDRFSLAAGTRVLAIGPSTGGALAKRGVVCSWPPEASEEGLVELLSSPHPR